MDPSQNVNGGRMPGLRPAAEWLTLAAALWALNFALSFHNAWPTLWIETRHELSVEVALLVLALAAWTALRRPASRRVVTMLAAVLLVLALGRYADVTAASLYGRPVNLYWDARHLPNVAAMLAKVASPAMIAAGVPALVGLALAVFAALRWALARVARGLSVPTERRTMTAVAAALVLAAAAGQAGLWPSAADAFARPVTGTFARQAASVVESFVEARTGTVLPPDVDLGAADTRRIDGADVMLVFLESYGATSWDSPALSDALRDVRSRFADAVRATGRDVASAFVESPTFAGASWLAHASLMTGLPVDHNGAYELLLTQSRDSLPRRFARSGYRTVAVMPGMRGGWPEGEAFYGFDEVYDADALAYRGPDFGWWRIPDQYALARLDELELARPSRRPLFVFFPTISTHIPFRPTPPYQPDWSRVTGARPYDAPQLAASFAQDPEWLDPAPAYADALRYAYEYWSGYLRARPHADLVLVMLGDHQPSASVTGRGARWDVPVHVVASRPQVLEGLRRAGFTAGVTPHGRAIAPMARLAPLLLAAFAGEAP